MEFSKYVKHAIRTESKDVTAVGSRLSDATNIRLLHAALGLSTEIVELNVAIRNINYSNTHEEIGDLAWYLAIAYDAALYAYDRQVAIPHGSWNAVRRIAALKNITVHIGNYVDMVKKTTFYDEPIEPCELNKTLYEIYVCIQNIAYDCGMNFREILQSNIAKLRKRYPDAFDEHRAQNRDVAHELSHIKEPNK